MNYIANRVGVHPDSCSALARKIAAMMQARTRPAIHSKRLVADFNRERHRDIARERLWRMAGAAFSRALPHLSELRITMAKIVAEVADKHRLTPNDLLGPRRDKRFVLPRHEALYRIASERPDLSYPQIAGYFERDHTSVLHAVRQHARRNGLPALTGRLPQ